VIITGVTNQNQLQNLIKNIEKSSKVCEKSLKFCYFHPFFEKNSFNFFTYAGKVIGATFDFFKVGGG
jgi:hypothetical protein